MSNRKLRISFGAQHHAEVTKVRELDWQQLCHWLVKEPPESPSKEARGWYCGAEFSPPTDEQSKKSELPGYRHGDNFIARHILTFDFDHVDDFAFDAMSQLFKRHAFAMYTTWSHGAEGKGHRFRIVLPLSRPASFDEFQAVSRKVAEKIGIELVAAESHVPAQFMFAPLRRPGGEHRADYNTEGNWVDVDGILAQYADWTDRSQWPRRKDGDNPYDKEQISSPLDKPGPVGDFCRAFRISEAIDRFGLPYTPTANEGRWTYTGGSRPEGAVVYDDDTKLHSHHDTDPARGQSNAFDLVRAHRFHQLDASAPAGTVVTELPSYRAMCQFTYEQKQVREALAKQEFEDFGELILTPEEKAEQVQRDSRFQVLTAEQFLAQPRPTWIIKGLVPRAEVGFVMGKFGAGKSFVTLDMSASVTRGVPDWKGHKVVKGRVCIIAAEGSAGMRQRYEAYMREHKVSAADMPAVIAGAPNLIQPDDVRTLAVQLRGMSQSWDMIVVDTLAASTPGADENSGKDMGQVISACKYLHAVTGAVIVLVAHVGKDEAKGLRGWSGLSGAADFILGIDREGEEIIRTFKVTKQKDGADGVEYNFKLKQVVLGLDEDGDSIDSCVIEFADKPKKRAGEKPQGRWQQALVDVLGELTCDGEPVFTPVLLNEACKKFPVDTDATGRDNRRTNFNGALQGLVTKKIVFLHPENRVALHDVPMASAEEWLQ